MGLENNAAMATFVNIKEGKLVIKKNNEVVSFDSISGVITAVKFKEDEFEGRKYEKIEITITDGEENFILSMRTDSGYFRGLSNSLRTGDPTVHVRIAPNYKKEQGANPQTTCFVQQRGVGALKFYSTKADPKDLPALEKFVVKGQDVWDSTNQINYWKNWWNSIQFISPFLAAAEAQEENVNTGTNIDEITRKAEQDEQDFLSNAGARNHTQAGSYLSGNQEIIDDLPF